jgi:hypothetical protein
VPSAHHPTVDPFATPQASARFDAAMRQLARDSGSVWVRLPDPFHAQSDDDFLDYGHLNQAGGEAFTRYLATRLPQ